MYHVMAIANYEDRFVIPSTHREYAENTFDVRGGCGFSFGNGCSDGDEQGEPLRRREETHHSHQGGGLIDADTLETCADASGSLRVLARLLGYPDAELRGHLPEMRDVAARRTRAVRRAPGRAGCADRMRSRAPIRSTTEADYVQLFDRGRATSLHLFEHVHGDSRDRGPAMIDLAQTYEKAGLYLAPGELPDYLPVVLEFVSTQPPREARAFLGEMAHIFNALFSALQQRESAYASVLGALLELAGEKAQAVKLAPEEPLDESWAEPPVFDGCSSKGQAQARRSRSPSASSARTTPRQGASVMSDAARLSVPGLSVRLLHRVPGRAA